MDNYIKTALRATGEAWTVFKTSASTGQNPKLAFQQLRDKYKDTDVEGYVTDYTQICEEELPRIKNAETYMAQAKDVGNKVFQVFKANAKKVFTETMSDDDWNRIIKMASDIGYRQYQRLHHIKDDWWKFV